jgi:DNA invertase Pin-like site-specific DNA recombinase
MSTRKRSGARQRYEYETVTLPAPGAARPPRKWGYARVSTGDQSTDLQIADLEKAGCDQIITDDGVSGATANRPGLIKLLGALAPGDSLTVWKLDRLGRSLSDLINILDGLKAKEVTFRSLKESIDTETAAGRMVWQMLGVFAEFERLMINERLAAGQKVAMAKGVRFGRKPKLSEVQMETIRDMHVKGKRLVTIAATFHVSKRTITRALALRAPGGVE